MKFDLEVVDDVIVALQHQRREAVHDLKNIQGQAQRALTLYYRDGDVQTLMDGLNNTVSRAKVAHERLTR